MSEIGAPSVETPPRAPALTSFVVGKLETLNMDALTTVVKAVPEWHALLDNLNGQIALRQFELAQLSTQQPSTGSLRNKGSTESLLRPKNLDDAPADDGNAGGGGASPVDSPAPARCGAGPENSSMEKPPSIKVAPPPTGQDSSPLQRRTSDRRNAPKFTAKPSSPTAFRKRKTESLYSAEGQPPKYRTRSMIIVYYDSQVQITFEQLVKFISASRNSMRKGKMAARMAEMRRLAEIEAAEEERESQRVAAAKKQNEQAGDKGKITPASSCADEADTDDNEFPLPKLRFVSTRRMGPTRDALMRGQRGFKCGLKGEADTASPHSSVSIFDELDAGLEWCQSMCEHAAHQFLRDGDCNTEISNIKRRLTAVKETAELEIKKSGAGETEKLKEGTESTRSEPSRMLKPPQMRRPIERVKKLEVDEMEVDDEGFEDEPPMVKSMAARDKGS